MKVSISLYGVFLLLALASGCSTTRVSPSSPPDVVGGKPDYERTAPPTPVTPARPPEPSINAAYADLVNRAEQARERGDYDQALALLERVQRIDPGSAEVYLNLARTHRARGDQAQARAVAERGLLYCDSAAVCDALRGLLP